MSMGSPSATSDRTDLIDAIRERSGEPQAALDRLETGQTSKIARIAMREVVQERERQRQQEIEQQQRERTDDDTRKPDSRMRVSTRSMMVDSNESARNILGPGPRTVGKIRDAAPTARLVANAV
ncbi:MAG: hypothetical protein WAS21_19320 [Geminicoccaceae bacterium]